MKVTYHDPCHLARGQGIKDAPRNIIEMIPGVEFEEMKYPILKRQDRVVAEEIYKNKVNKLEETEKYGKELGIKVYLGAEIRFTENNNDYLIFGVDKKRKCTDGLFLLAYIQCRPL